MYTFAFLLLAATLCLAVLGAGASLVALGRPAARPPRIAEAASLFVAVALSAASGILTRALAFCDFSVIYVADYTDRALPLFYRLTAFWAGQPGSLLFWAFSVALCGAIFQLTPAYGRLSNTTRHWYWVFYLSIIGFFGLLLTTWSNPFLVSHATPPDGSGLNPLLQNPGMIFHPPLLFLGYGGFVIPGCLALAQSLNSGADEARWTSVSRPFMLAAWALLSAGIVLGAWWAYMELGWGGYWAWDPVENASLIPWLIATAALHTMLLDTRRGKLGATTVFLVALTTISAFFATYLVRSGVVQSVHAFGNGGVGNPLLLFVLSSLILSAWIAMKGRNPQAPRLSGLESREGFLVITTWLLLLLAGIILVATLWPVITALSIGGGDQGSMGLTASFYNRVCLPLFAGLVALLAIGPWLRWDGGLRRKLFFAAVLVVLAGCMVLLWIFGYRLPTPLLASSAAFAVLIGHGLMLAEPAGRTRNALCVAGIHAGVALIALGIAFSGPYKIEKDLILKQGESAQLGAYTVTLNTVSVGQGPGYQFLEGELHISLDGKPLGVLAPQRRIYDKWSRMQFAEAATLFSPGNELYASLLAIDEQENVQFRVSVNPLVNWIWLGGTLLSVIPFLMLGARRAKKTEEGC